MLDESPRSLPDDWVVPEVTPENRAFFTTGELRLQRCAGCGSVQHPPLDLCIACGGFALDHVAVSPEGTVESYTVVHHPLHPTLADAVPYNVVVVSLADHPHVRIVGNVIDAPPDRVRIGARVRATWAVVAATEGHEELRLPQWRLVEP